VQGPAALDGRGSHWLPYRLTISFSRTILIERSIRPIMHEVERRRSSGLLRIVHGLGCCSHPTGLYDSVPRWRCGFKTLPEEGLTCRSGSFTIGNPFGLARTLTTGVISPSDRRLPTARGREIVGVMQTDENHIQTSTLKIYSGSTCNIHYMLSDFYFLYFADFDHIHTR
jgi:hypothetical protein